MNRKFLGSLTMKVFAVAATAPLLTSFALAAEVAGSHHDPQPAQPGEFTLKVEPGIAFPLTKPQSQSFKIGGGQTIKVLWGLNRYLDLGPSATVVVLPAETSPSDPGTAWAFGGGLRVKRPHDLPDDDAAYAISPWLDADLLYVRTGPLNRPGFAAAAGVSAPIGESRYFWIGPFVRYLHILQGDRAGFNNADAKILSLGISLEVGSGVRRDRDAAPAAIAPPAEIRTVTVNKEVFVCPDRDNDDVPDKVDHCPDVAGPLDNWGCPAYKKIIVQKDKLELKERLYFAWNQATLQEVSFPALDEVVQALKDNKDFRVQVEGHSSSEGGDDRNQTLSEKRAASVLDYLVAHGISRDRLTSKGFSSSVPADTNATVAGRENNRRVEFVVHFNIVNDGSK